jgi:hypothetical protein
LVEAGAGDLDEAGIISAARDHKLAQFGGVEGCEELPAAWALPPKRFTVG